MRPEWHESSSKWHESSARDSSVKNVEVTAREREKLTVLDLDLENKAVLQGVRDLVCSKQHSWIPKKLIH